MPAASSSGDVSSPAKVTLTLHHLFSGKRYVVSNSRSDKTNKLSDIANAVDHTPTNTQNQPESTIPTRDKLTARAEPQRKPQKLHKRSPNDEQTKQIVIFLLIGLTLVCIVTFAITGNILWPLLGALIYAIKRIVDHYFKNRGK